MSREWCMPNSCTFQIKPIAKLLEKVVDKEKIWIDAFSNNSKVANITNDLNPCCEADYHMDALDFFKTFADCSVDGVLYDPPYSLRQVVECYKGVGVPITMETTQSSWRSKHIDEIARIVKPGGMVVSFGWNSSGVGKVRGFEIVEILLVAHGGSHNDTIATVERKGSEQDG